LEFIIDISFVITIALLIIGMDTEVEASPDFFGRENRNLLAFGRSLPSNAYVKGNSSIFCWNKDFLTKAQRK